MVATLARLRPGCPPSAVTGPSASIVMIADLRSPRTPRSFLSARGEPGRNGVKAVTADALRVGRCRERRGLTLERTAPGGAIGRLSRNLRPRDRPGIVSGPAGAGRIDRQAIIGRSARPPGQTSPHAVGVGMGNFRAMRAGSTEDLHSRSRPGKLQRLPRDRISGLRFGVRCVVVL